MPVQYRTPECALSIEIPEIHPAQRGICGKEEIQAHKLSTWPGDPRYFVYSRLQVRKVPEAVAHEYTIEAGVRKWQQLRIPADGVRNPPSVSELQHPLRE